jgi:hypothetical protein
VQSGHGADRATCRGRSGAVGDRGVYVSTVAPSAGPRAIALICAVMACVAAPAAPAAARPAAARPCPLPLAEQQLPGGTAAYAVTVSARGTSCAVARRVTQAFHRCRGDGHSRCARRLLGSWRCSGVKRSGAALGLPIVFSGTASCRSGARRVQSGYQENFPACYGAAARDPQHPCANTTKAMFPGLDEGESHAFDNYASGCDPGIVPGACISGADGPVAREDVALIGDSHTFHWRAALGLVAQVEGWRIHSVSAGGCFFSKVTGAFLQDCDGYYTAVLEYLQRHPEIHTVFTTSNADTPVAVPDGQTNASFKIGGFLDAWAALPATVRHVVVLRDTTNSSQPTFDCLARAIAAGQRPGTTCALARPTALRDDLAVAAVAQARNERYRAIDLSHYFCGSSACYPVIGGVRVNADIYGHLTPTYLRTVGPYLLRELRRLRL